MKIKKNKKKLMQIYHIITMTKVQVKTKIIMQKKKLKQKNILFIKLLKLLIHIPLQSILIEIKKKKDLKKKLN